MPQFTSPIEEARRRLGENPCDVRRAWDYWRALATSGQDVRSGRYVADAFARAAVSAVEGAIAFAQAYQELFYISGERPRAEFVSTELKAALRRARETAAPNDADIIGWVLSCVED